MERFLQRRERFMSHLGDGIAVIPAAEETTRNADTHHPFRQDSDFYFLTGFPEPEAIALLDPSNREERYVLFTRPRDREREAWDGKRAGVEGCRADYGADAAYPLAEFDRVLRARLRGRSSLSYRMGNPSHDARVLAALRAADGLHARAGIATPTRVIDPSSLLHELRLVKSAAEIDAMRLACEISANGHAEAMRFAQPGFTEREVQAALEYVFRGRGSPRDGYPSIVASGANATILHYVENDQDLMAGELLLIDAGAEYGYMSADITRTFPIDGTFTAPQRAVYDVVLGAQRAAYEACRPGVAFTRMHEIAVRSLAEGMIDLGLLPGTVDEVIAKGWYREFYFHGTGHWLGMDVHDAGTYRVDTAGRMLVSGMVFTVEPGIYVAPDKTMVDLYDLAYDEDEIRDLAYVGGAAAAKTEIDKRRADAHKTSHEVPAEFLGIGVRIEDDILITNDGYEILTSDVPVDPDEIEEICAETSRLPHLGTSRS